MMELRLLDKYFAYEPYEFVGANGDPEIDFRCILDFTEDAKIELSIQELIKGKDYKVSELLPHIRTMFCSPKNRNNNIKKKLLQLHRIVTFTKESNATMVFLSLPEEETGFAVEDMNDEYENVIHRNKGVRI